MNRKLPTILMTGGTGLVGSRLIHQWRDTFIIHNASIETGIDLLDPQQLVRWMDQYPQAQALIHLAAYTNVRQAEVERGDHQGLCYQLNVSVTQQIISACQARGLHFIYVSTDYVFDGQKFGPYIETDEPNPLSWYGQTKYLGEQSTVEAGLPYTIVRIAYPFRTSFSAKPDWVQGIKQRLIQGTLYPMFSDQWITPVWVDDLARAWKQLIIHPPENKTFHTVGPTCLTPYEAAQYIADQLQIDASLIKPGKLKHYLEQHPEHAKLYPKNLQLSNQRFQTSFSFNFTEFPSALPEVIHT